MSIGSPPGISLTRRRNRRSCRPVAVWLVTLALACTVAPAHSQASVQTPEPVVVINRTAIELSGLTTLSQLLSSRSAFNVFGIRGLSEAIGGSYRLDGRPVTGLDFSIFPLSSVERIELVEEGATRYRGHTGAGTINIVRRRDFQGTEVSTGLGRPDQSGIDSNAGSALWGGSVGRGRVLVGIDHVFSEEVRDSERSYTRTRFTDSLAGARSVSIAGNTLLVGDDSYALGACNPRVYTGALRNGSGEVCGYAYGDVAWFAEYPRSQRESLFLHADHPIGERAQVYLDVLGAQTRTRHTWAPSPGTFALDVSQASGVRDALEAAVPGLAIPADGSVTAAHRFVAHGTRTWRWDWDDRNLVAGIRGALAGGLGYDAHIRHYRVRGVEHGDTFVSEALATAAILSGDYDLVNPLSMEPAHLAAIHRTSLHSRQHHDQEITVMHAAFDGSALALPGGPVRWTTAFEFEDYSFRDVVAYRGLENRAHAVTRALGSSGSIVRADRHVMSADAGASLPVLANWELVLTGRLRDYDDVGGTPAWRVSSHYRANDVFSVRLHSDYAELSPGVRQLYESDKNFFPYLRDCKAYLDDPQACVDQVPVLQVETEDAGNPDLVPAKSRKLGVGTTVRFASMVLTADWYRQKVWNQASRPSAQHLVNLENRGQDLPPGAHILRVGGSETGTIEKIVRPLRNHRDNDSRSEGLALRAGAAIETAWALLDLDINYLRTLDSQSRVQGVKQPGDYPRHRAHAVLRARRGDWTLSWNAHTVSRYDNPTRTGRWNRWTGHDLALQWQGAYGLQGLRLSAGALNVDDRKPALNPANPDNPALSYDSVRGRTYFVNASLGW